MLDFAGMAGCKIWQLILTPSHCLSVGFWASLSDWRDLQAHVTCLGHAHFFNSRPCHTTMPSVLIIMN